MKPEQNGRHIADDTFKWIFLIENCCILIKISLEFVPESLIHNKSALVKVMAWCQEGNKPLPEPMLTQFMDWYIIQPQWVEMHREVHKMTIVYP